MFIGSLLPGESSDMRRWGTVCDDMAVSRIVACSACALFWHSAAWARDGSPQEDPALAQSQPSFSDVWDQITDPRGLRSRLEQAGLKFTFRYFGDALGNPWGGVQQGLGYSGRLSAIVDADLERLAGWSGATFHVSTHQIHGPGLSANNLENLMVVSGVEAPSATRLFNLWIEQKLGTDANLRVGQFTAAQEFAISENANLFVNSAFGWPFLSSQDLPSGGPNYPEGTTGVRLKVTPNDQLTLMAAIFDGNPAGPGVGDPVRRDPSGIAFRVNNPALFMAELAYEYGQDGRGSSDGPNREGARTQSSARPSAGVPSGGSGLPGTVKVGAWIHTGLFADERFNTQGGSLAVAGGQPLQHRGNFAVYGIIDQMLWRADGGGDRGMNFFLRAAAAPSERNLIGAYFDTGLTFKGPMASRPDDTAGLGFAFGRVSRRAAGLDLDAVALTGTPMPIRDYEAAIELTYQVQLTQNWSLQPDIQYIIHPGGNVPNPLDPGGASPIPNAFVAGMRTNLKF
jgi:porin